MQKKDILVYLSKHESFKKMDGELPCDYIVRNKDLLRKLWSNGAIYKDIGKAIQPLFTQKTTKVYVWNYLSQYVTAGDRVKRLLNNK